MLGAAKPERTLCTREYQRSIAQSVHKELADNISELGMNYLYEVQRDVIRHRTHETEFLFEGLHGNIDKIKSFTNLKRAYLAEANNTTKDSFEKLDPTIRGQDPEIWIEFNPELETDFIYERFVLNPPANALVRQVNWRDNPWFPESLRVLMEAKKAENYDEYLNIWEGQTKLLLAGAVYAEELRAARAGGRICRVPYEPSRPVDVSFDLGRADMTSLWLTQGVGFELRFVDFYENCQKPIGHYIEWLQARRSAEGQKYLYGSIELPHDAKAKRMLPGTVEDELVGVFGRRFVRVLPRLSVEDGINAARTMFPICWFDAERCKDGLQHLSHYRYEVVDEKGRLSRQPVHDEHSHAADSFRYKAIARRVPKASGALVRARREAEFVDSVMDGDLYSGGRPRRPSGGGQFNWMRR